MGKQDGGSFYKWTTASTVFVLLGQFIIRDVIPAFNKKDSRIQSNTLLQTRMDSLERLNTLMANEKEPEVAERYQELIKQIKLKIAGSRVSELKVVE